MSHIAIYTGGGNYIHASKRAGKVIETSISRPHSSLTKIWYGARRISSLDDTTSAIVAAIPPKVAAQR